MGGGRKADGGTEHTILAVAENEERRELGLLYTSEPNILKVLNPLFLDHLQEQLERASATRDGARGRCS